MSIKVRVDREVIAELVDDGSGARVRQIVESPLGTSRASLFDGVVTRPERPEPFGATSGIPDPGMRFAGHDYEPSGGVVDMGGRLYDPGNAVFLSPDPVLEITGPGGNPYQYAYWNPNTYNDPTGFFPCSGLGTGGADVECGTGTWDSYASLVPPAGFTSAEYAALSQPFVEGRLNAGEQLASHGLTMSRAPLTNYSDQVGGTIGAAVVMSIVEDVATMAAPPPDTTDPVVIMEDYVARNEAANGLAFNVVSGPAVSALTRFITTSFKNLRGLRHLSNVRPFNYGANDRSSAIAAQSAEEVPRLFCRFGHCDAFSFDLAARLQGRVEFEIIFIQAPPRYGIWSPTAGDIARRGHQHFAIRVGDRIFDNLRPGGIKSDEFFLDLGGLQFLEDHGFLVLRRIVPLVP